MYIKTKKYKLTFGNYIRFALWEMLKQQWYVSAGLLTFATIICYFFRWKWGLLSFFSQTIYVVFLITQLYATVHLSEEGKVLFGKLYYLINNQIIQVHITPQKGFPIPWNHIKKVDIGKDYFILYLSPIQFIYLPHFIFNGEYEISFMKILLKRKKLIL